MSATETKTVDTTDVDAAPEAPVSIPEAPPVPLSVKLLLDDGVPEIEAPQWENGDVPRDGDTLGEDDSFVRFDSKGEAITASQLAASAYAADKSKVDLPAFNRAYRSFQERFVQYGVVQRSATRLVELLAQMMMATRLAITLENGDPDYWGKSAAYRSLFNDRIVGFMVKQGFGVDETKNILQNVRTNYTRRAEVVINTAALNEAKRGNVEKVAGVKSAQVTTDVDPATGLEREAIVITLEKSAKDGTPIVQTWHPGDSEMPKPLATAIKQAARRADGGKEGSVTKTLPPKVAGKPKPKGSAADRANESGGNERNYVTEARDAFAAVAETIGHVAPLELVALYHESLTALSDYFVGMPGNKPTHDGLPGGPKAIGEALAAPGHLLIATGANMAADGSKGEVAKYRYTPENDS